MLPLPSRLAVSEGRGRAFASMALPWPDAGAPRADMHKSKFVLTYDRNGKLLSKHKFATPVPC